MILPILCLQWECAAKRYCLTPKRHQERYQRFALAARFAHFQAPFKVLEAPSIQDDFYLNLVDWSAQNLLAVGLQGTVYLWNAATSGVSPDS